LPNNSTISSLCFCIDFLKWPCINTKFSSYNWQSSLVGW